jgi:hypothetical protein
MTNHPSEDANVEAIQLKFRRPRSTVHHQLTRANDDERDLEGGFVPTPSNYDSNGRDLPEDLALGKLHLGSKLQRNGFAAGGNPAAISSHAQIPSPIPSSIYFYTDGAQPMDPLGVAIQIDNTY